MSRKCSIFISRLLNDLGYSNEMVKNRQRHYASLDVIDGSYSDMVCGSKGEGLTLPLENDLDQMIIYIPIECHEVVDGHSRNDGLIKFQLERLHNTAPGYTLLKCISLNNDEYSELVRTCLVEVEYGTYFMSSDSWKQRYKETMHRTCSTPGSDGFWIPNRDNQGPSSPAQYFFTNVDFVNAITCHCPQLISCWKNRMRVYDWPSSELIDTVSSLEAHVVPIGYKDSPLHFLEWRICFTKAELRLIQSLNDCQTKLIILLKLMAKHALQPVCREMSTYVMKNLVLWMAEKYPSETFVEDRLLVLLKHSLKLLKSCIMNKKLPSYMIEERNLFADRISDEQGIELCQTIEILLNEGARMLLRCPKIWDGLNLFRISPNHFYLVSEKRWVLEPVLWYLSYLSKQYLKQQLTNDPSIPFHQIAMSFVTQVCLRQHLEQIGHMLLPDVLNVEASGVNLSTVLLDGLKCYLS